MRHCWRLIAPLELYCASVSQYYLIFKLSGKVVFFHIFFHLSFYFFAPAAFILELHRCSKGRLISSVQTENCYYFRNRFCFSLIELSSGLLPLPFKVRITIDKKSPNGKLLLFSKRVLLVIVSETVEWAIALSETVEWAIAMLVAPLALYCAIVSGYYSSFKLSGKVVFLLGQELPTGDGWERASHWSCIAAPLEIIFLDTI